MSAAPRRRAELPAHGPLDERREVLEHLGPQRHLVVGLVDASLHRGVRAAVAELVVQPGDDGLQQQGVPGLHDRRLVHHRVPPLSPSPCPLAIVLPEAGSATGSNVPRRRAHEEFTGRSAVVSMPPTGGKLATVRDDGTR
jgi:hypothetical protein